jgi:hypothetical protein
MTSIGTKRRRRVRVIHPDLLRVIREDLATGASAPAVSKALQERMERDDLDYRMPSERTIRNIAREMARDDSGEWRLDDADPATVHLVLRILRVVVTHTGGRVSGFTKREAQLLPVIYQAANFEGKPRYSAWQTYLWVRFYLSWAVREQDAGDVVLALAALAESGPWPITHKARIDRVFNAVAGWLPPELSEVKS